MTDIILTDHWLIIKAVNKSSNGRMRITNHSATVCVLIQTLVRVNLVPEPNLELAGLEGAKKYLVLPCAT